jgi:hypothetical protein
MPVTTKVSAYSAVASALVVQNGQRVRFYPFSPTGDLPAPVLAAEALSATTVRLTWSDESLESGFTVQRRLVGEAAWIDAGTFPANTTSAVIGSLLSSTAHEFRIKADALATSSAWSNIATATTLASPPTITTHPSSYVVNTGTPVTFTVVAGGGTPVSYQWRKGGQNLAGATASSYTIASAQTGDAGSYDVVVTNSVGSVTSNSATLTIQVPPVITQQPVSLNVAPGGTATFTIVATGTPTLSYRWQRQAAGTIGFVNVVNTLFPLSPPTYSGASSVTLTISAVSTALNGDQFRCVVTNGASPEATSNLVTLTVSAAPLITSAASTTFTAGLPGSFIVRATGAPAPVFAATGLPAWAALDPNTGVLSGTPPSTAGSPASVVITASNGVAPNATQTFALNVQAGTGVPVITTHPVGQSVGVGASVTFSVIATGAAPLTYEWRKNGATLAGATGMIFAIAAASTEDAGKYDVIVRNGVGAATSRAAFLSVVPAGVVATHAVVGGGYFPGSIISVTNTLNFPGTAESLGWQVLIPDGWSFVSAAGGQGDVKPVVGTTGVLEWAWTGPVTGPVSFTYTLNVPSNDSGPKDVAALVTIRLGGWPVQVLALPDPLSLPRATTHSADSDSDGRINVFELTRVIELYNTRNGSARTGCYRVQEGSEDGFSPDAARTSTTAAALLRYHSADTAMGAPRDGRIDLSELTRVIELYNYRVGTSRTGQYHVQTGTEDGFAPGP